MGPNCLREAPVCPDLSGRWGGGRELGPEGTVQPESQTQADRPDTGSLPLTLSATGPNDPVPSASTPSATEHGRQRPLAHGSGGAGGASYALVTQLSQAPCRRGLSAEGPGHPALPRRCSELPKWAEPFLHPPGALLGNKGLAQPLSSRQVRQVRGSWPRQAGSPPTPNPRTTTPLRSRARAPDWA